MQLVRTKLGAVQNLGLVDRVVRMILGFLMVGVVLMDIDLGVAPGWHLILPILSIYPFITGILGWDPLYAASHVKSCDTSRRNQCGTFPYEAKAAMGKNVQCGEGFDCSLPGSEHEKAETAQKQ
jgi:hypothetical protein